MADKIVNIKRDMAEDYNYMEAIKTLRTNIQFCGNNIHAIAFTSCLPDEGKSDISFELGRSLAQIGKRVVVVDADMRKSVLMNRYQINDEVFGLSQYLSGQKALDQVVYQTNESNLSVIFAGPYSVNPAELMSGDLFKDMMEELRQVFDYILIDTPPSASLIDSSIAARECDGSVIIIESGAISYHLEQKVKNQLESSGTRILGVVLNKVDIKNDTYYSRYGGKYGKYKKYGYNYSYGYGADLNDQQ